MRNEKDLKEKIKIEKENIEQNINEVENVTVREAHKEALKKIDKAREKEVVRNELSQHCSTDKRKRSE